MSIALTRFNTPSTGAAQNVTIAHGLAETPKALIFFTVSGDPATGWTPSYEVALGFWATGMTHGSSVYAGGIDAVGTPNERRASANDLRAFNTTDSSGTFYGNNSAYVSSVDATNVTIHYAAVSQSVAVVMVAIGGPNVLAKVVRHTMRTATGNQAVTGVGFTPDVVLHIDQGEQATTEISSDTDTTANGDSRFGFGWMTATEQAAHGWAAGNGGASSSSGRRTSATGCLVCSSGSGALNAGAGYVSMDADGFTINYSVAAAAAAPVYSLCLKGVRAKGISFAKKNGTGSQAVTGVGFTPQALITIAPAQADATSNSNIATGIAFSAAIGGSGGGAVQVRNGLGTADDNRYSVAKAAMAISGPTSQSLLGEADLSSFDSDGFTLNWTTSDTTTNLIKGLALRVPDWSALLTDLAAASDAIARATSDARALSDTAGASDSMARQTGSNRAVADTAGASDAVARQSAANRTLSDAGAASDSVVRQSSFSRAVADTAGANDAVARATSAARALSDTGSASDAVARQIGYPRALADSAPSSDVLVGASAVSRSIGDTAAATDAVATQRTAGRAIADAAPGMDIVARAVTNARPVSDSAASSDSLDRFVQFQRGLGDSAPANDAVQRALTRGAILGDTAAASDALTRQTGFVRSISDGAPALDAVSIVVPSTFVPGPTDLEVTDDDTDVTFAPGGTDLVLVASATDADVSLQDADAPFFGEDSFGEGFFGE